MTRFENFARNLPMRAIVMAVAITILSLSPVWADNGFKEGAKDVGEGFKKMGQETGQAVKEGGKEVGEGLGKIGKATGEQAKKTGGSIGQWFKDTGKKTGDAFKQMGKSIKEFFTGE